MDIIVDTIASKLGQPILTSGDEVRFNCFRKECGGGRPDTKYHLYVNPTKNRWFCQRCRAGGTIDYMFKLLGIEAKESSVSLFQRTVNEFIFGISPDEDELKTNSFLPEDFEPVFEGTKAYLYLKNRGISDLRIERYRLGFGTASIRDIPKNDRHKFAGKGRIIIPDFDVNGNVDYWVARTYSNHKAKYKNDKSPRKNKVFNLGSLERDSLDRIVICEGPISAIIAGFDAVATYGKHITRSQFYRLAEYKASTYVVAFDGDALPEGASLASRLMSRGLNVKFIKFDEADDPASVGSLKIRRMINSAVDWSASSELEILAGLYY